MELQADAGDRAGAISTFHKCAEMLDRELQVKPSQATETLVERLASALMPLTWHGRATHDSLPRGLLNARRWWGATKSSTRYSGCGTKSSRAGRDCLSSPAMPGSARAG